MAIFNKIFIVALIAGTIAGLFLAVVQQYTIIPMILEAETYEVVGDQGGHSHHGHSHGSHDHAQEGSSEEAWAPENGYERTFFTVINIVFAGIGFGLLLTACYTMRRSVTWHGGLLWGLAGFVVFHLAPALGLPPVLPGDAAAGVGAQQGWWLLTVAATASGLMIVVFQPIVYLKIFGLALIILPHLFGAPQPEVYGGLAPDDLRSSFIVTSLITNAAFWILLGLLSASLFNRVGVSSEVESTAR